MNLSQEPDYHRLHELAGQHQTAAAQVSRECEERGSYCRTANDALKCIAAACGLELGSDTPLQAIAVAVLNLKAELDTRDKEIAALKEQLAAK